MPIMASYGQDDARGAAWLLATTARNCLHNPEMAPEWQDALNNAYRLLEAYRVNTFFGVSSSPNESSLGISAALTVAPEAERNLPEVLAALDETMDDVFAGKPRELALDLIADSLRAVAYPSEEDKMSPEDRRAAAQFFEKLVLNLHYA